MKRALAITFVAAAVFGGFFLIPARPRLTHMDFVVGGPDALGFCDAANPRFLPVVARDSPVTASLAGAGPYASGQEADLTLVLRTDTGKAIGPKDLLSAGGRKLEVFAIDPSLKDFQVLEPQPGNGGAWRMHFTPRLGGAYRFFADFTPAATGQEIYVATDLAIHGPVATGAREAALSAERGGPHYQLSSSSDPLRIREAAWLTLGILGQGGAAVIPDSRAGEGVELVAFDRARTGMVDLRLDPDRRGRVSFADSGPYAVWAVVHIGSREERVPFAVNVEP
jgi:hypothetical protein